MESTTSSKAAAAAQAAREVIASRPLPSDDLQRVVPNPGKPRADVAPSVDSPDPPPVTTQAGATASVLQAHCAFFDANKDGVLTVAETYDGFRKIGFGRLLSGVGAAIIHASFSLPTVPAVEVPNPLTWLSSLFGRRRGREGQRRAPLATLRLPDPAFRVFLANISRGKHGSDTGAIDTEGRFVPEKFEEVFSKYAGRGGGGPEPSATATMLPGAAAKKAAAAAGAAAAKPLASTSGDLPGSVVDVSPSDSLTWADVRLLLRGDRVLFDAFGAVAAFLEWSALHFVASQKRASDGRYVLTRERARQALDGTLFPVLAMETAARERSKQRKVKAPPKKKPATTGEETFASPAGGAAAASASASAPPASHPSPAQHTRGGSIPAVRGGRAGAVEVTKKAQ